MLDERFARDERERFAGEPRRSKARGNDTDDFHADDLATAGRVEASSEAGIQGDSTG
jgi:hypothetical protein